MVGKSLNNNSVAIAFAVILLIAGGGFHQAYAADESKQTPAVETSKDIWTRD